MFRRIFSLSLLCVLSFSVAAQSDFQRGNEAFKNGNYQRAITLFQQALDSDGGPAVRYNLGLSHYRLGQ